MNKTCIIIAGPTAVGKTALAIQLAQHYSTEIISADSRQCFQELNIGVAKPSIEELDQAHHYFINSHSINDPVSAAGYEKYALSSMEKIVENNDVAIMVGGTGLYIKAFCEGLDEIPNIDEQVRKTIVTNYNNGGMEWLQQEVKKQDPEYYIQGEIFNPQRMLRALEVKFSTGQSITSFQRKQKKERPFNIIKIGLELPRPVLYNRINKRVDDMIGQGLEAEVKGLIPFKHLNALQTVGYRELFDYYDGLVSRDKAIEMIKQNTRHYAKRQMTWFKKDNDLHWVNVQDANYALQTIHQLVKLK
jgi:tRNA dimethylallyltransferase